MSTPPFSAFCLAASQSGSGKTTLAAGLLRAFVLRGLVAQGFKCGPDYVDPSFHAVASGLPAYNLDTWMMGREGVRTLFARHAAPADAAVCEGVMGLLDGREASPGAPDGSTMDCAVALRLPLVLVIPVRGMGGSAAALAAGFVQQAALRGCHVAGIIANHVGSERHVGMLRTALERAHLPPLLGALPRDPALALPERQLGLVPAQETAFHAHMDTLAAAVEAHVRVDELLERTRMLRPVLQVQPEDYAGQPRRLGIARDEAFCFYYEENEAALRRLGWTPVPFSPLDDHGLPPVDALYLGGGYPEVFARRLAENTTMREAVRLHAAAGKEIWAECGGYMYLCRELRTTQGEHYPMVGVFNATAIMGDRLRSLGYREVRVRLPFGLSEAPTPVRGHEFHWSHIEHHDPVSPLYPDQRSDAGACIGAVRAGYIHLYWGQIDAPGNTATGAADNAPRFLSGGQVIVLNGPSSAGKTSLAQALRRLLAKRGHPAMVVSMDDFLRGCEGESARETAPRLPVVQACHAAVAEAARCGALVIADHVLGEEPGWLDDLLLRLGGIPVHGVQVRCAPEELVRRELAREDRPANPAHALRQHAAIHGPLPREVEVDTTHASPEACAACLFDVLTSSARN